MRIAVLTKDEKHYDLERSKYIDVEFDRLIAQLEKDPALRQRMGKAGQQRVAGEFSVASGAARWLGLLQDLRQQKGAA